MAEKVWEDLKAAREDLIKRAHAMKKAFIEMPGGAQPGAGVPPEAAGVPPEAAGVPPEMAGAAGAMPPGGDPAAAGVDPAMLAAMGGAPVGVDSATAGLLGGVPPVDPTAGAGGAVAGAGGAGTPEPTITITLSQLWEVVKKVLGLAKQIGANGQGVAPDGTPAAPAAPAAPAGQDAIKAAVIEALGDMGLNQMKMASAAATAQRSADWAALRKSMADAIARSRKMKRGQTNNFTPDEIAALQAYKAKHGEPDINKLFNG